MHFEENPSAVCKEDPDLGNRRLVVVSNRLPFTLKQNDTGEWTTERGAGGLVRAMDPLLQRSGGIWIGWPGESSPVETPGRREALQEQARHGLHVVELSSDLVKGFYEGFSNQTLWPLFHYFPFLLKFDPRHWADYRQANERFCEVILPLLRPTDLVWVHDYQLMLLPQMLRAAMPEVGIGFFLHIPFPPSAVFQLLPRGEELLEGVLGADFVAFHTHAYLQHFRDAIQRRLGLASQMDRVEVGGRSVHLEALPISIDPKYFSALLSDTGEMAERLTNLRAQHAGRRVIVAVDRLDYTKGIPQRLRTFGRLLRENSELRGKVVLIQVAVPSREEVPTYKELAQETDELAGKINGEFAAPDWTPLIYMKRGVPPEELAALYATSDVAWVSPLRDGMNLVAKEYIACSQGNNGVLVLSEFAGAAAEMGEALLVNPYDEERSALTLARALEMPPQERRQRMKAMYQRLLRNDVYAWGERFLNGLQRAAEKRAEIASGSAPPANLEQITRAFRNAGNRLLLLDYDGTLVPFANRPQDAAPSPKLLQILKRLAADPQSIVAIVSGRSRQDLDRWFSAVPGLSLAAEHGAIVRTAEGNWHAVRAVHSQTWKPRVLSIFEHFTDRLPGSFIEEKEFSLVWHYRMADPAFAEWVAHDLISTLNRALSETEWVAQQGHKIIEVKLLAANKAEVLTRLGLNNEKQPPDFLLFAGDDQTDEDLFASLPQSAWTIHVGTGRSHARYRLDTPEQVRSLLRQLADALGEPAPSASAAAH